jgi:hypothetical protein
MTVGAAREIGPQQPKTFGIGVDEEDHRENGMQQEARDRKAP